MTITKEGALASFYTVNKAPIKHLRVHFSPKQAGSGDASPENVREISGWDGVDVYHTKTNLFSYDVSYKEPSNITLQDTNNRVFTPYTYAYGASWSNWWQPNQVISCTVNRNEIKITTNRADYGAGFAIPIKSGKTLHISYINKNNIGRTYLAFYDENGKYITGGQYESNQLRTIPEDAVIIVLIFSSNNKEEAVFTDVSVTYEDTFSYEPYSGQNHTLDWSNNIGTIPGGYIDLVTGELAETYNCIALDSTAPFNNIAIINSDTNLLRFRMYLNEITNKTIKSISNPNFAIFNYLKSVGETTLAWNGYFTGGSTNPRLAVYVQDNNITSIDSFLDYLNIHPLQVCYELETPIIHQLTPTQLSTLIGRNNIWSNADRVEVEYDLAESNDELYRRRNIILRSSPHIEVAAGSIVSFNTDIAAPLKEAKIYFNPMQEGEGDPSPENIRPINGWTGLTTYYSGENLYIPNANNKGYINANGVINVDTTSTYTDLIPVTAGETYSFKCTTVRVNEGATNRRLHGYDSNGNWVKQITNRTTAAATVEDVSIVVTIPSDVSYIRASFRNQDTNVRIAKENVVSVNWSTEVGTIYGGYTDLATGEVWETHHKIILDGVTTHCKVNSDYSDSTYIIGGIVYLDPIGVYDKTHDSGLFCDTMPILAVNDVAAALPYIRTISAGRQYLRIYLANTEDHSELDTKQKRIDFVNAYLMENPITVVYPLMDPQLITTLTPTQLKALKGPNNIWSNSNGNIEIKYWTH